MWAGLVGAIQFLTCLPLPSHWSSSYSAKPQSDSLVFYPLVGLIIGLLLFILAWLTMGWGAYLQAGVIVTAWIIITGALHIDGLADSADAWLGGHGDKQKTLHILNDTYSGVAAIVSIVLIIILKILAIAQLNQVDLFILLLVPVLGRSMVIILLITTPYVRADGIGQSLVTEMPVTRLYQMLLVTGVISVVLFGLTGLVMIISSLLCLWLLRFMMLRRLQGTTGDTAGAVIELSELAALLAWVAMSA